jgi:hypothetical protein
MKREKAKVYPDRPIILSQNVPEGWATHQIGGHITPLSGNYQGIPMKVDSPVAIALGFPSPPAEVIKPYKRCPEHRCFVGCAHTHCSNCALIFLDTKILCPKCGHTGHPVNPDRKLTPILVQAVKGPCSRCGHKESEHYRPENPEDPHPCSQCSCYEYSPAAGGGSACVQKVLLR